MRLVIYSDMPKIYHGCGYKKSNGLNMIINRANNETCHSPTHMAYWKFRDTKKHKVSNKRYLTRSLWEELKENGQLFRYKCFFVSR